MIRGTKPAIAALFAVAFALSGCTTDRYAHVAGQFGELTSTATKDQKERLTGVAADENERYHQMLAKDQADLRFTDCADQLLSQPPDKPCRIVIFDKRGVASDLPPEFKLDNIIALNTALDDYAQSLITLAADSSSDREKFADSVDGLATSVGGLDGAIRKATGATGATPQPTLNVIAGLVAKIGNLYLTSQRAEVMKRIIIESDPLVQKAVGMLAEADNQLDLYDRAGLHRTLVEAQENVKKARSGGDPDQIRGAQDALFAAVRAYNGPDVDKRRFAAIGKAHTALVRAAQSGASLKELQDAIEQLLDLASTVKETATSSGGEKT